MKFFTSDTHFFHKALLPICRPEFKNVEDMHQALVMNWNSVVRATDEVFHLGDVTFGSTKKTEALVRQLNGHKYLVLGNHDHGSSRWTNMGFDDVVPSQTTVFINGRLFQMSHFPYQAGATEWHPKMFIPDSHLPLLCGHVHTAWRRRDQMLNVGVELNAYTPVSEDQIAKEFGLTK